MLLGSAVYDMATKTIRFVVEIKVTDLGGELFIKLDSLTPKTYIFPDQWRGELEWLSIDTPPLVRQAAQKDFDYLWGKYEEKKNGSDD